MPSHSNTSASEEQTQIENAVEKDVQKQTKLDEKQKKISSRDYSRSLSSSERFATLKNFRKKSLSKIINGWKSDNNDEDLSILRESDLPAVHTAGILKVFVGSLSLGSNYKSILVTTKTTSKNALRMILERYNIPPSNINRYILCEVTGKMLSKQKNGKMNQLSKAKSLEGMLFYVCRLTSVIFVF